MADYLLQTTGRAPSESLPSRVVIAGDWCGKITGFEANVCTVTLDYPINCADALWIKCEIDAVFDELLRKVGAAYNKLFGLDKDAKYYKIVVGRWIYHFLHNVYEKRAILNRASLKYPGIWLESCGKTHAWSFDSDDYSQQSYSSHDFNFRMYSGVAEFLSSIRKRHVDIDEALPRQRGAELAFGANLKSGVQSLACEINRMLRDRMTLVVSPNYPRCGLYNRLWFFLKSGGEIVHYKFPPLHPSFEKRDPSLRKCLARIIHCNGKSELQNIASSLIFNFMPESFVEHFATYREQAQVWLKRYPKISRIFTTNAIHTDEPFKYLVAEAQPLDLWISQHGAGYGFSEVQSSEDYEREIANRYFTWGWGENVLPHPKLLPARRIEYKKNNAIVFTLPTVSEYAGVLESYFIASNYQRTLCLSDQLVEYLSSEILSNVVLRQREIKGFRMYKPPIEVREDEIPDFHDSLKRARLHLSNHIGTPVLESLAMNVPTVVICDPTIQRMRLSAAPFFERLKDVQILFEDPVKAAHHINSVYASIDDWWMCDSTQAAVRSFCSRFAQSDRNWKTAWLNALRS